jgi:hypothetical protein
MSHLTASPFHKPSPYQFPRAAFPVSPPETDSDSIGPPKHQDSLAGEHTRAGFNHPPLDTETPTSTLRRVSTLGYHHSGFQTARDKSAQRSSNLKTLVVIIPPLTLSPEQGHTRNLLSLGPRNRLNQGILMPLFPTVCSSLSAIISALFNFFLL